MVQKFSEVMMHATYPQIVQKKCLSVCDHMHACVCMCMCVEKDKEMQIIKQMVKICAVCCMVFLYCFHFCNLSSRLK